MTFYNHHNTLKMGRFCRPAHSLLRQNLPSSIVLSSVLPPLQFGLSHQVMGWYLIMKPTVITEESETPIGQMCIDVFGAGWAGAHSKLLICLVTKLE